MHASIPLFTTLTCVVLSVTGAHWLNTISSPKLAPIPTIAEDQAEQPLLPFQQRLLQNLAARHQRSKFQACFAPGTSNETVERFYRTLQVPDIPANITNAAPLTKQRPPSATELTVPRQWTVGGGPQFFQAPDSDRWSTTATNGSGLSQGDPTTLTWGIVPDDITFIEDIDPAGQPDQSGPGANSDLQARLNALYGDQATWLPLFEEVFARWAELTGVTYVYEPNDDAADLFHAPGVLGVRPDVRIGGRLIDGNSNILAFNYFPDNGDMVIDTNDSFYNDLSGDSLKFRNVIAHEHGHGLGIAHVCPVEQTKLMEPFVSTDFYGPQHDDLRAGQRLYGDRFESNDSAATATDLGMLGLGTSEVFLVSLDGSTDSDYYTFTTDESYREVTLTATPVGFTYLNGAQNSNGSCQPGTLIDSSDDRNLRVEILASDGTTVMNSADLNPAGQSESLTQALGNSLEPFYVRVVGDAVNLVQLYTLELAFGSAAENDLIIELSSTTKPVLLGDVQTLSVAVSHTGPGNATVVAATVPLPTGLDYLSSAMVVGTGNLTFAQGALNVDLKTLTGQATTTFEIQALRSTASALAITASATRAETDPVLSNNSDSIISVAKLSTATNVEEFNAFPGFSGTPPSTIPNDTTGSFQLFWGTSTTTATGFALDESQSANGRGLHHEAAEDTSIWPSTPFPQQNFTEDQYQMAFWFRFSDEPVGATRDFTQMLVPVNQQAIDDRPDVMAFVLSCGRDAAGVQGIEVRVPSDNQIVRYINHVPATPAVWHQCVVQYSSASSLTALDASLNIFIDPIDGNASPQFSIDPSSNIMSSYLGNGPLGRYSFGAAFDYADPNGPKIWLDRVGTWDGYGTAGKNDLQAAIDFFYPMASIQPVSDHVTEAHEGVTSVAFRVFRTEEIGIPAAYNWAVTGDGSQSADNDDFAGGVLPSGQVTFAAGESLQTINIPVVGDEFIEPDEPFQVTLTSADGHARVSTTKGSAIVTIDDDDAFSGALTYTEWAATAFATAPLSEHDIEDNPDDDSWPNAFEYLFGTDPEIHDLDPIILTTSETHASITYPRDPDVVAGTEILESSLDLDDWTEITPISTAVHKQPGSLDQVTITVPLDPVTRVFYRLHIP